MHTGQQTMSQSVILKLTKDDSKQSVKSQCHLAAGVENIVSQLIFVFTTLTDFQTNPRTNVQQNFCESLLWYL